MPTARARVVRTGALVAGALASVLGLAVGVAPAADAATGCTIYPPARVVVDSPAEELPVAFGPSCGQSNTKVAYWAAVHSGGRVGHYATYGGTYPVPESDWTFLDTTPVGTWTWQPRGAYVGGGLGNPDPYPVPQNSPSTDIRYGSGATLTTTRRGTAVTFTLRARRWSGPDHAFVDWNAAPGVLQYLSGSTWKDFRTLRTGSTGTASTTVTVPGTHSYRVVIPHFASTWGATTRTSTL